MPVPSPDRAAGAEALRLLDALEIAPCDCELLLDCPCEESCTGEAAARCPCCRGECQHPPQVAQPLCVHQRARAENYRLSVEEWAELQHSLCPEAYDDPPRPPAGANVLTAEAVVAVYAQRVRANLSPYHPEDLWRRCGTDDTVRVGPVLAHAGNGYDVETGEVAVAGRIGPRDVAPRSLADALLDEVGDFQRGLFERGTRLREARERAIAASAERRAA